MNGNQNSKTTVISQKLADQIKREALEVYADTGKTPHQLQLENHQMRQQLINK